MQLINGIVGAITSKTSPQKGTPYLEIVIYSLDHQTDDGKNKPVYVRVWEPFISEFERRIKVKDRVQLPIDRIRENLTINQEGKPVSYYNANFSMFSYLYSGGGNGSTNNANNNSNGNGSGNGNGNNYNNNNNGNSNRNYNNNGNTGNGNYNQQRNNQYQNNNNSYQNQNQNQNQNRPAQNNNSNYGGNTNANNGGAKSPQNQVDDIEAFLGSI